MSIPKINGFNRVEREYLERLTRRRDFLLKRLSENTHKDLTYDKAEASALSWAIETAYKYSEVRQKKSEGDFL